MAEYLIQDSTLTGIADGVRSIIGVTKQELMLSPSTMQSNLETFNTDMVEIVAEQDNLIAQIITALEGKIGTEQGASTIKYADVVKGQTGGMDLSGTTLTIRLPDDCNVGRPLSAYIIYDNYTGLATPSVKYDIYLTIHVIENRIPLCLLLQHNLSTDKITAAINDGVNDRVDGGVGFITLKINDTSFWEKLTINNVYGGKVSYIEA